MRRTKYNKGKKASAFISNLYRILMENQNGFWAKWCDDEESFIILNIPKFSQIVLPKYFKHSNYSSFVRQLNMYNFNKLRSDNDRQHIFKNDLFAKNNDENLKNIKRREVISTKNSNILSFAQALNDQIQSQSYSQDVQESGFQKQYSNQIVQLAAPSEEFNFLANSPILERLRLTHSLSDYLFQSQKIHRPIPSVIPLNCQQVSFPLKSMIDQMKNSQNQLQEVCIGLYKQNQFLTTENKRLQDKLKFQFKKKQQILDRIMKYVIIFLTQWNANSSQMDEQNEFCKQAPFSDEQSSSDIILESYNIFQKRKFQKNSYNRSKPKKSDKSFTFSKYAQNEKKILLTLLKQIQKSYNEKFFFTGSNMGGNFYQQKSQFGNSFNSANSFLMSMLLKFIQSNNLTQVVKRFSLLINLQRNKKSKNFTVVNCMKDLTQHFKSQKIDKSQSLDFLENDRKNINNLIIQ